MEGCGGAIERRITRSTAFPSVFAMPHLSCTFLRVPCFEMPPVGLFPGYSLSLPRSLHHCLHLARALVRIVELFFLSSITLKSYDRRRTEILKFASYS
jgi:hypothetical protein